MLTWFQFSIELKVLMFSFMTVVLGSQIDATPELHCATGFIKLVATQG